MYIFLQNYVSCTKDEQDHKFAEAMEGLQRMRSNSDSANFANESFKFSLFHCDVIILTVAEAYNQWRNEDELENMKVALDVLSQVDKVMVDINLISSNPDPGQGWIDSTERSLKQIELNSKIPAEKFLKQARKLLNHSNERIVELYEDAWSDYPILKPLSPSLKNDVRKVLRKKPKI